MVQHTCMCTRTWVCIADNALNAHAFICLMFDVLGTRKTGLCFVDAVFVLVHTAVVFA